MQYLSKYVLINLIKNNVLLKVQFYDKVKGTRDLKYIFKLELYKYFSGLLASLISIKDYAGSNKFGKKFHMISYVMVVS